MQAAEILRVDKGDAGGFLGSDEKTIVAAFHRLVKVWHPDRNGDPQANAVMSHLVALRDAALATVGVKQSVRSNQRVFERLDGSKFAFTVLSSHLSDVGEVLVGPHSVVTIFSPGNEAIAAAEGCRIDALTFLDEKMEKEMRRFLPDAQKLIETRAGLLSVQSRPEGHFLLADIIARRGDRLTPKHVAWITSGLLNIASYLDLTQVSHGAISPTTILISPKRHKTVLVGGWGFAFPYGERRDMAPARTLSIYPTIRTPDYRSSARLDLELIRQTALDMVGAASPAQLRAMATLPAGMTGWITSPAGANAVGEYAEWHRCVEKDFGPRRFTDLEVTEAEIYGAR